MLLAVAIWISPKLRLKATCSSSVSAWSRNSSTAHWSIPASIAATVAASSGRFNLTPSTSPIR